MDTKPETTIYDDGISRGTQCSSSETLALAMTPAWSSSVSTTSKFHSSIDPPIDPLRTPIPLPTFTPISNIQKEQDEEITRDFVHASCRLYEATVVTAAACNRLICDMSGLDRDTAASTAQTVVKNDSFYKDPYSMPREAIVLQMLLTATEHRLAAIGAMAGMVIDARASAVEKGYLLSLSGKSNSSDASYASDAAIFATYTNGTTAETDMTDLLENLDKLASLAYKLWYTTYTTDGPEANELARTFRRGLRRCKEALVSTQTCARQIAKGRTVGTSGVIAYATVPFTSSRFEQAIANKVRASVCGVVEETRNAAERTKDLADAAVCLAEQHHKAQEESRQRAEKQAQKQARKMARSHQPWKFRLFTYGPKVLEGHEAHGNPQEKKAVGIGTETYSRMGENLDTATDSTRGEADELDDLLKQAQAATQQAVTAALTIEGRAMQSMAPGVKRE